MASATTSVTFTGAEDSLVASWTPISSSIGYFGGVQVSDGSGFVGVTLSAVNPIAGTATVNPSARFSGTFVLTVFDK